MKDRHTSGVNTGPMELPDEQLEQLYGKPTMDRVRKQERRHIRIFWLIVAGIMVYALIMGQQ